MAVITHLVMFRYRAGVSADDPRVAEAVAAMAQLPEQVPGIRSWRQGAGLITDAEAWDYGLCAEFNNREALEAYFVHHAHLPVLELWNEIAELGFVDFSS